jgi:ATP:ADP antiporter, AAA family
MRDKLFTLLGIESGEESMVSMLLAQSFFLGIFFGAFDIIAHSLFLSIFNEKMLARGYVISGITGIILTSIYSWFQTRVQFRNFAVINLIIVTSITLFLWFALILSPAKWLIFIVFIMLVPLNIIALLGFWGTTGRLFTLKQGKRLSRIVDAGLIIGIIIISFSVPLLLSLKFQSHNILLVSASSVLVATIIQIMIGASFNLIGGEELNPEKPKGKKSLFTVFWQDPYLRIIVIFIALSVLTAFFIQYSFLAVTREQFPAVEDMARFLGIFTGCMMIFTLSVKLVVFSSVLHNYGLRTCLIISPILIAVFTIMTIAIGLFMGYTPETTSGFMIFFLLLAFSRLFSKSLKDSMEFPSLKVIYQTLDKKITNELQSGTVSTVNEIATFSAGLILTGMGIISFVKLIHFSLVLFLIILIWVFVAIRLYKEYRKTIRRATEKTGQSKSDSDGKDEPGIFKNRFSAYSAFRRDYFSLISGDYTVLDNIGNKLYFEKLIDYTVSKNDINLLPVLKKIANNSNFDEEVRQGSTEAVEILEKHSTFLKTEGKKISDAKKILSGTRTPQPTEILRLLRDNSIESKRLAIYMIGKFKISDLLFEVCQCLNISGLEADAFAVLRTFNTVAEDELLSFYLVSSGNTKTSKIILRLLGKTCTKESLGFLCSRLWSNSRQLKEVALKCLIDCEFKPSEEDKDRLNQLISETIGFMTWNLSAKICLENNNNNFLLKVMEKEISRWNRFLFNLLSITYSSGSITTIIENLESETVESVYSALEMIDLVVNDSIKAELISLFDVVPDEEKLKDLCQFFPGEIPKHKKLLEDIINRDYNLISLWAKACALRNISEIEGNDMAESVVALLFSPEGILQEEAANLVARSSRELYKSASQRIPESVKSQLDKIVSGEADKEELIFEKILFLSKCFEGIPEEDLLPLAVAMKYIKSFEKGSFRLSEGCIIWLLFPDNRDNEVHLHYDGQITKLTQKYQGSNNLSFYFLPLDAVEEYHFQFPDKTSEILKYIEKIEEYNTLSD